MTKDTLFYIGSIAYLNHLLASTDPFYTGEMFSELICLITYLSKERGDAIPSQVRLRIVHGFYKKQTPWDSFQVSWVSMAYGWDGVIHNLASFLATFPVWKYLRPTTSKVFQISYLFERTKGRGSKTETALISWFTSQNASKQPGLIGTGNSTLFFQCT